MRRVRIKPSRAVSFVVMTGGIAIVVVGFVRVIPTFGVFGVAGTLFALAVTVLYGFNVFTDRGAAVQEIDVEGFGPTPVGENQAADRLERLEDLRARNLITEEEYRRKRAEIIERL